MKFTESMLTNYSQPLSATEDGQCKNAIRMVADALKTLGFTDDNAAITPLYTDTFAYSLQMRRSSDSRNIKLFVQGSYANNTNVRTESDVDVAVIQEETFLPEYRKDSVYPQSGADYGFTPAPAAAKTFKDEVQEALKCKFGTDVERKNKSIKVHGNTYRKDADTVPCRRYRDYRQDYRRDASNFVGGVVIYPDNGGMIINYPEQHGAIFLIRSLTQQPVGCIRQMRNSLAHRAVRCSMMKIICAMLRCSLKSKTKLPVAFFLLLPAELFPCRTSSMC